MKKNILLVQSFLVLPLITSSIILSMNTPETSNLVKNSSSLKIQRKQARLKALGLKEMPANFRNEERVNAKQDLQDAKNLPYTISDSKSIKTFFDIAEFKDMLVTIKEGIALDELNHVKTTVISLMDWIRKDAMTTHFQARTKASGVATITRKMLEQEEELAQKDLEAAKDRLWNINNISNLLWEIRRASLNQLHHVEPSPTAPSTNQAKILAPKSVIMELPSELDQSTLVAVESTGFDFTSSIFNALKSYSQIVINLLEKEEFKQFNGTHKEYFNAALEECATNKDLISLEKIINACQKEKYQSLQSAVHHVAPAFNYVSREYQAQIVASNKDLVQYNQQLAQQINDESAQLKQDLTKLLNQHREKVTALTQAFETRVKSEQDKELKLKNLVAGVAALNAKVAPYQKMLIETHNLTIPTNSVKEIEDTTHYRVRALITHSNMPQANVLQIDNK